MGKEVLTTDGHGSTRIYFLTRGSRDSRGANEKAEIWKAEILKTLDETGDLRASILKC